MKSSVMWQVVDIPETSSSLSDDDYVYYGFNTT